MTFVRLTRARRALALAGVAVLAASCSSWTGGSTDSDAVSESPSVSPTGRVADGWLATSCAVPLPLLQITARGYFPGRGPDLTFIPRGGNPFGNFEGTTTHSGPWDFLQEIPLIFYGPGFIRPTGSLRVDREVTITDVVPTHAELLRTDPPSTATGDPIPEVLVPRDPGSRPRLIVTIVWDGGGWNVLNHHDDAWPFLRSLIERGASVENAIVGSSPSITPAVHSNLGTGTFPRRHGIVNILQGSGEDRIAAAFGGIDARKLRTPTLADVYDRALGNEPKIGMVGKAAMHLGMIGHGAGFPGGDRDVATLLADGVDFHTNEVDYALPEGLDAVEGFEAAVATLDREDGEMDGKWLGHDLPKDRTDHVGAVPFWTLHQTSVIEEILAREGFGADAVPDLFYVNYKDPDYIGHAHTFMSPEVRSSITHVDDALRRLVRFLDATVGERRWVLTLTADHGQAPDPAKARMWPINVDELRSDIDEAVGRKGVARHIKQNGIWLPDGVDVRDLSDFLVDYTIGDNAGDKELPSGYEERVDEPVFDAAFPSAALSRIMSCARTAN